MVVVAHNDSRQATVPLSWLGEVVATERLGPRTMAVRSAQGGIEGAARATSWLAIDGYDRDALLRDAAALIGPPDPNLLPPFGLGTRRGRVWLVSALDPGVDLGRFVDKVKLSPAQALLLAGDVIAGVAQLHNTGRVHARLHPGNVLVGLDGRARLTDWAVPERPSDDGEQVMRRSDQLGTAVVIEALVEASRCPAGAGSSEAKLLATLKKQLRSRSPATSLRDIEREIVATCGDGVRRRDLRDEVAALVAATAPTRPDTDPFDEPYTPQSSARLGAYPPDGPPDFEPTAQAHPQDSAARQGSQPHRIVQFDGKARARPSEARAHSASQRAKTVHRTARTVWGLALALAVLGLLVGLELTFLHGPITRDLQTLRGGSSSTTIKHGQAVVALPAGSVPASGPVRGLDVRTLHSCAGGQSCLVRVLVDVNPQRSPVEVAWRFRIYNRCGSSSVTEPGGIGAVAAGTSQLVHVMSVQLPPWPWMGLGIETTAPLAASSAPWVVPASGGRC